MTKLTIWLPETAAKEAPAMLNLAHVAPVFRFVSGGEDRGGYVAEFPDMVEHLHVVVMMMEEIVKMSDVRLWVNDWPVARPMQFWSVLLCFWESQAETNAADYCLRRSARVSEVSGCPDHACKVHCQFICTRCLDLAHDRDAPPVGRQFLEIARRAEVDWCPNLRLPV